MGAFALRRGMTPLDVARAAGQTHAADWLQQHGAEPGALSGVPLWLMSSAHVDLNAPGGSARKSRERRIVSYLQETLDLAEGVGSMLSFSALQDAVETDAPVLVAEAADHPSAQALVDTLTAIGAVVRIGE